LHRNRGQSNQPANWLNRAQRRPRQRPGQFGRRHLAPEPRRLIGAGIVAGAFRKNSIRRRDELCVQGTPGTKAPQRDDGPNGLDQSERPSTLQKSVNRAQRAGGREGEDEPVAAILQRVTRHRRDREQTE